MKIPKNTTVLITWPKLNVMHRRSPPVSPRVVALIFMTKRQSDLGNPVHDVTHGGSPAVCNL